jgi:subtilase family serine protease
MFGTSMYWALGAFADAAMLAAYTPASDSLPDIIRTATHSDTGTPSLPYVDSSTLTVCQLDSSTSTASDDSPATAPQAAADTPVSAKSSTSDEVFAGIESVVDSLFDDLDGSTSAMGDVLHPGTQTPAIPNSAAGVSGATLQSAIPALTSSLSGGTGGLSGSHTSGAALATLANFTGGTASSQSAGAAASAAPSTGAAANSGGTDSPFAKAHAVAAPDKVHTDAANGAAPFSPSQIQGAYGVTSLLNAGDNGTGQTIYIVDAYNDPNIASDLATFDTQWGLPKANLTVHKMSSRIRNNSSWGVEESLDVEWAHAIAPAANIVLVEATSASNSALFSAVDWATNNGAKIVSMSFGGGDSSSDTGYDTHFEHAGVTYIASAGDTAAAIEYPAASPYVLSIGGTSLTLTTGNAYSSETAWADSGGGVSTNEKLPGYQSSYGISNSGRSIPDVAWDADPNTGVYVYDSYVFGGGGWYEVGGTSVGAPSWAGLIALADQNATTPLTTDSLTSRIEYTAATGTVYASNYHDITSGSNGHAAGTGYDLVTGVGSPQANNLVPYLSAHG